MKRIITTIILACMGVLAFGQQSSILRQRMEIAELETEILGTLDTQLEVFYMNDENPRMYYLSLGNLGFGTDLIQIEFDPIFELFIPLGNTLTEAIAKMEEIKAFYKQPRRSTMELTGCFAALYPNANMVTVTATRRQVLSSKLVEFSLPTGDERFVRATYISKSDFSSLLGSLKIYKKLHPKEQ